MRRCFSICRSLIMNSIRNNKSSPGLTHLRCGRRVYTLVYNTFNVLLTFPSAIATCTQHLCRRPVNRAICPQIHLLLQSLELGKKFYRKHILQSGKKRRLDCSVERPTRWPRRATLATTSDWHFQSHSELRETFESLSENCQESLQPVPCGPYPSSTIESVNPFPINALGIKLSTPQARLHSCCSPPKLSKRAL